MKPIERLFEAPELPRFGLPPALAALYGGDFGLPRRTLYANFVASADGVVALPEEGESGRVVSGDSEADRFIMGLLRACADAVVIGAGTFRKAAGDLWYPESVFPAQAALFAELRQQRGLRDRPLLVIVSTSGNIDPRQPALRDCLIVTTPRGIPPARGAARGRAVGRLRRRAHRGPPFAGPFARPGFAKPADRGWTHPVWTALAGWGDRPVVSDQLAAGVRQKIRRRPQITCRRR